MLSVKGEDELSPFYSVCFPLPMLCQTTMKDYVCEVLVSSEAYKAVVECLIKLGGPDGSAIIHDNGSIFLASDTVVNLLTTRDRIQFTLDDACFVRVLGALAYWIGDTDDLSAIMMATTVCALEFDQTSEEALLRHPSFEDRLLMGVSQLIARSLAISGNQMMSDKAKEEFDLHQTVVSGYSDWADRFPLVREAVERYATKSGQSP